MQPPCDSGKARRLQRAGRLPFGSLASGSRGGLWPRGPARALVGGLARLGSWLWLAAIASQAAWGADPQPRSTSTVGMPARIEQLVLPGTELEVRPIDDRRAPIVVRIVGVYPHGSAFRYDLAYYGLEPGRFDLRDSLRRKDGSSSQDLAPIPVGTSPVLPPGQVQPHRLAVTPSPSLGGYRLLVLLGGLIWVGGLAAILLVGRRRQAQADVPASGSPILADRLRPLVEAAMAGRLSPGEYAELERLLFGYWRRRLGLEHVAPAHFLPVLRNHEEAGPLLHRLEVWLHRPAGSVEPVDVAALLRPYRAISAEEPATQGVEKAAPVAPAGDRPGSSSLSEPRS